MECRESDVGTLEWPHFGPTFPAVWRKAEWGVWKKDRARPHRAPGGIDPDPRRRLTGG